MKNSTLWIAGSVLLILTAIIIAGAYFFLQQSREPATGEPVGGTTFPSSGGLFGGEPGTSSLLLTLATGERIPVNNFLANGITFADPANAGSYYLAGKLEYCLEDGTCPDTNTPKFSILFSEEGQSFFISLNEEPLRESRLAAEAYLMNALGISKQEMCNLSYLLGTTVSVNETYGSITNLGFSFCEGAVPLP